MKKKQITVISLSSFKAEIFHFYTVTLKQTIQELRELVKMLTNRRDITLKQRTPKKEMISRNQRYNQATTVH